MIKNTQITFTVWNGGVIGVVKTCRYNLLTFSDVDRSKERAGTVNVFLRMVDAMAN
jgi:hypothetical protein